MIRLKIEEIIKETEKAIRIVVNGKKYKWTTWLPKSITTYSLTKVEIPLGLFKKLNWLVLPSKDYPHPPEGTKPNLKEAMI